MLFDLYNKYFKDPVVGSLKSVSNNIKRNATQKATYCLATAIYNNFIWDTAMRRVLLLYKLLLENRYLEACRNKHALHSVLVMCQEHSDIASVLRRTAI